MHRAVSSPHSVPTPKVLSESPFSSCSATTAGLNLKIQPPEYAPSVTASPGNGSPDPTAFSITPRVSNFDYDLPTRRSAMQLLALLPPPPRAIGIMELAGDLQIDRRGILGLITTLQHRGFGIERDLDTQTAWATKAGWERIEHEAGRWIDENE